MNKIEGLLDLLNLEQIEHNIYRGQSQDIGSKRVFGGQVLAQALQAASQTVDSERLCHSLHAYFILPGDISAPIVFNVDRIRDGGSFTTRRVIAIQHGRPIFNMAASFQLSQPGLEHSFEMPSVPDPDELPTISDLIKNFKGELPRLVQTFFAEDNPIIYKPFEIDHYMASKKEAPFRHIWFKANGSIPDLPMLHRCVLAYVSDFYLLGTALLPHGIPIFNRSLKMASLDHAIWFHRDFKADDWLLYAVDSPNTGFSRGFCRGQVFTREGQLVASVCQEGMIRLGD